MKKKLFSIIFCLIFFSRLSHADTLTISFNPVTAKLNIGSLIIKKGTSLDDVKQLFGTPTRTKNYKNNEVSHYYENYGIVFTTIDDKVKLIGITFNADGDDKFTNNSFNGILLFGTSKLTTVSTAKDISNIDDYFECLIPELCATKKKNSNIDLILGFQGEGKPITQFAFLIN
jgi:hypothetical protein